MLEGEKVYASAIRIKPRRIAGTLFGAVVRRCFYLYNIQEK